jgi:hypothetical protein
MKLQIDGQQWRLRVDEDELRQLLAGQHLAIRSLLPEANVLGVGLGLTAEAAARFEQLGDGWRILLPAAAIDAYVARLPSRDGVSFACPVRPDDVLTLSFQVDVRDSIRSRRRAPRRA